MANFNSTDRTYAAYYKDVGRHPIITADEELALFTQYSATSCEEVRARVRARLVSGNLRFVIGQAHRYTSDPELFKDLISAGNIGLLNSIDRFDLSKGFRFLTYAGWWVRKEIRDELSKQTTVRVPVHRQKQRRKNRKNGIETPPDVVMTTLDVCDRWESIDFEDGIIFEFSADRLRDMLRRLTIKQRDLCIVLYYFGIADQDRRAEPKTLKEISEIVGVTPERVRQIKSSVIEKLKAHLETKGLTSSEDFV